jgi:CheY-like chemotaxis protein
MKRHNRPKKIYTGADEMTSLLPDVGILLLLIQRDGIRGKTDMNATPRPITRRQSSMAPTAVQSPNLSGMVLLVEDEPLLRRMMRRMLERLGLTVVEASDGVEALELFGRLRDKICLVLMDWNMPRMSGYDTLSGLRGQSDGVPILVLSGQDCSDALGDAVDYVQGFLAKPFPRAGLEARLREVLA